MPKVAAATKPAPFDTTVRCDRCGAHAKIVTRFNSGDLAWCNHHFGKHVAALVHESIEMDDRRL